MPASGSPPNLKPLAPELLDQVLDHLLEGAKEVEYLGRGSWSDTTVLDFFNLSHWCKTSLSLLAGIL